MSDKLNHNYRIKIICFYGMIIFILLGLVCISVAFAYWVLTICQNYPRLWPLAFFPVMYALIAVVVFLCYKPHESRGLSVTKESAPELFYIIENTTSKVGYKDIVEEVVLTPGMSVSVYYNPNLANFFFDAKAKLYIGVLLCRILSTEELSAAIAHELAHFSQPQMKYKAYLARITNIASSLGRSGNFLANGDGKPIQVRLFAWPAKLLYKLFNYLCELIFEINSADYLEVTAEMELEADKNSARAFGADVMLSALCKSYGTSSRMAIYKALVLPYISSYGYRCNGFWNTFEASSALFKSIDGLNISRNKSLLDLNRSKFDLSEWIFVLRYDALKKLSDELNNQSKEATIIDIIPRAIQKKMDDYLCRKYGHNSGVPIGVIRMGEILEELRLGLFVDVHSIPEAFVIVNGLLEDVENTDSGIKQIALPEYVRPANNVFCPSSQGAEFVYASSLDKCPVCGWKISEDTKICPHCHEVISE